MPSTFPALAGRKETDLETQSGVALMRAEKILIRGAPMRERLRKYLMFNYALFFVVTIIGIPFLPLAWWIARTFANKHGYWVTDSRVIVTNGIVGFRTRSIPLERVSDVAISSNWLEKWMGLRSVVVRDMTGEAMSGASMFAAGDATKLQQEILDQVHKVNRRDIKPELPALAGHAYRDRAAAGETSEVMELLRRIEANTRAQ